MLRVLPLRNLRRHHGRQGRMRRSVGVALVLLALVLAVRDALLGIPVRQPSILNLPFWWRTEVGGRRRAGCGGGALLVGGWCELGSHLASWGVFHPVRVGCLSIRRFPLLALGWSAHGALLLKHARLAFVEAGLACGDVRSSRDASNLAFPELLADCAIVCAMSAREAGAGRGHHPSRCYGRRAGTDVDLGKARKGGTHLQCWHDLRMTILWLRFALAVSAAAVVAEAADEVDGPAWDPPCCLGS